MAVIILKCFTKSCIRNRMQQGFAQDHYSRLMFRMIVLLTIAVGLGGQVEATPSTKGCNLSVSAFATSSTRTLTPSLGPVQPIQGPICGSGSCCAPEWEHQLISDHRNTTERYLRDAITRAAAILETRGQRVDDLFRAMMNTSKHDFHTMFVKTYGMIYIQNADVFEDMYQNLEVYYSKGSLQLTDMMDHFFSVLYQRMFKVINGDYEYDEKYLACVADHMGALKPFDDVPQKLGLQLRRSFVATRVFYKSLIQGGRVAAEMLQLDLPVEECGAKLTRMHHCGRCLHGSFAAPGAESDTKACFWHCKDTYTGCLRDYMELGADWDKYIDAIDKVADRLIGPFNIEMVVQPIDIKISEAIMNFQENREEITKKVFSVCGKPQLKRRRRNASTYYDDSKEENAKELPIKKRKFQKKRKHKKTNRQQEVTMDGFEKEIYEIKTKIKELRQFWSHLPYQLCNNNNAGTVAPPNPTAQCWTGTELTNSSQLVTSTQAPPSTTSATSRTFVQNQASLLQTLTFRLKDAYNGNDVNYPDEDNVPPVVEVDGSGDSGSGTGIDDDIDLDLERGSGDGGYPVISSDIDDDEDNTPHRPHLPSPTTTERKVQLATAAPPPVADTPVPPYRQPTPQTTSMPSVVKTNGAPSRWELRRAVLQYVMPVVAVWFGNALSTLL